jgi:hypothetical protein
MVDVSDPQAAHRGEPPERRPIDAARERLGRWLSAEPGRSWDRIGDPPQSRVELYDYFDPSERGPTGTLVATGEGETMADAILAAIEKASGAA